MRTFPDHSPFWREQIVTILRRTPAGPFPGEVQPPLTAPDFAAGGSLQSRARRSGFAADLEPPKDTGPGERLRSREGVAGVWVLFGWVPLEHP